MKSTPRYGFVVERKAVTPGLMRQVHGAELVIVESAEHARQLQANPPSADCLVTWQSGVTLPVFTADCIPVLLYTEVEGPIAAVHAGWRGAKDGIVAETVKAMRVPPRDLVAVIGPSILACCFEVKEDFLAAFRQAGRSVEPFLENRDGRYFFDLVRFVVEADLSTVGQIDARLSRCTYCSAPPLPSFRRNGNTEVRLRSWIQR